MIGPSTRLVALLGDPVDHSLSPRMHNAAFRHLGLDCRYLAFRVFGERFEEALRGLGALGALGANVTVPHKERARRVVDALDELPPPRREGALLLGAGGAARAAALALAERTEGNLWVAARNPERIRDLEASLPGLEGRCRPLAWGDLPPEPWDLLVQATPLGLPSRPWDEAYLSRLLDAAPSRALDLAYRPEGLTELEEASRRRGIPVASGRRLLLHQGVATFRLLTDREPPLEIMEQALEGGEAS